MLLLLSVLVLGGEEPPAALGGGGGVERVVPSGSPAVLLELWWLAGEVGHVEDVEVQWCTVGSHLLLLLLRWWGLGMGLLLLLLVLVVTGDHVDEAVGKVHGVVAGIGMPEGVWKDGPAEEEGGRVEGGGG